MRIAIVGPEDFTIKGKYPQADDAAAEFVLGLMEELPRYATIINGGTQAGVGKWVLDCFAMLKDSRRFHLLEFTPTHGKDKPFHELDYTERNKGVVSNADKLFAIIPDEYNGGETADLLQLARQSHIPHTIFRLTPRGDVASVLEIKAKDTFIPVELKEEKRDVTGSSVHHKLHNGRTGRKLAQKQRVSKSTTASGSVASKSKSKARSKASVPAGNPLVLRRVSGGRSELRRHEPRSTQRTEPRKAKVTILKRKIGKKK